MLLLAHSQPVGLPYLLAQDLLDAGERLVRAIASTDLARCGLSCPGSSTQQGVGTRAGQPDLTGELRHLRRRRIAGEHPTV
jgi:hypothetical protein